MRHGRLNDFQGRHVAEPGFEALAVLGSSARAGAGGKTHHHRHRTAKHVADLGRLVDELLHSERGEVGELEFVDGSQAGEGRANGNARAAEFGDRGVYHAVGAVFVHEVARNLEGAAIDANFLAHQDHALVRGESDIEGLADARHVQRLVERAFIVGAIAKEANDNRARLQPLGGPRRSDRNFDLGSLPQVCATCGNRRIVHFQRAHLAQAE